MCVALFGMKLIPKRWEKTWEPQPPGTLRTCPGL